MNLPTDPLFEQLSKEIVVFCENNRNDPEKSIDFVRYELYHR